MNIEKTDFGKTPDGDETCLYTLTNSSGLRVELATYGATLVSVEAPDRTGKAGRVMLGYETLEGYVNDKVYLGTTVGRYCNRIAGGRFTLDGVEYELACNNGPNHLHGGILGFNKFVWAAEEQSKADAVGVRFTRFSADGEEGYPGNLNVTALYCLTEDNELKIDFVAISDKTTVVNLTNHAYWNLADAGLGDILAHELTLYADRYLPGGDDLIPTGELRAVADTPMDFTKPAAIGSRIDQVPGGYDSNWILTSGGGSLAPAARVYEPTSGRIMEILTTQPGIQLYSGNFLDGSITGPGGAVYGKHHGFCLETQHWPDSPNKPDFPSTVLRPGETYRQTTVHRFSAE